MEFRYARQRRIGRCQAGKGQGGDGAEAMVFPMTISPVESAFRPEGIA